MYSRVFSSSLTTSGCVVWGSPMTAPGLIATRLLRWGCVPRLGDDGVEGRLGLIVGVEQERAAAGPPGNAVVRSPKRDDLHRIAVLEERSEEGGIFIREAPIGIIDEAALGGGGVAGDIRTCIALAALRAVNVEFGDVNREPELFEFCQRSIFRLKAR